MVAAVVVYPDVIELVRDFLLAVDDVTNLVGETRIFGRSPADVSSSWLRINRLGGLATPPAPLDHAYVQVDAFTTPENGDVVAMTLARVTQGALLYTAAGFANSQGRIASVYPWTGMQSIPDTSRTPPFPRVFFGVTVSTRPV